MKRYLLAVVAVFIAWSVMDFIIHGVLLGPIYAATREMWRPEAEMKMGLMSAVTAGAAVVFVAIYAALINPKSIGAGAKFGALFGLTTGISMGFGTYGVMPIPLNLALGWLAGAVVEALVAGLIVGAIMRPSA